jgi:hypothetical protein
MFFCLVLKLKNIGWNKYTLWTVNPSAADCILTGKTEIYWRQSWTKVLIKPIDTLGKYNQITSYWSPLSPTQCCHNFSLILNVVQQHCFGGKGVLCFRQNTGIKLQFKLSQRQIKILLTCYVHDCIFSPDWHAGYWWPGVWCNNFPNVLNNFLWSLPLSLTISE